MPTETDLVNQRIRTHAKLNLKQAVQNLIDIYQDNWEQIIEQELIDQLTERTYRKYRFLITQELNVLKRVVKELSIVYKDQPERKAVIETEQQTEQGEITIAEDIDPNYDEAMKDSVKDFVMQQINRYTNLINHTVLKVVYRDSKLDYDILNFNNVEVYSDPQDWMDIIAVKHYFGLDIPFQQNAEPKLKVNDQDEGVVMRTVPTYSMARVWVKEDIPKKGIIEDGDPDDILQGGFIYTVQNFDTYEIIIDEKTEPIPYKDQQGNPILPFVLYSKSYPVDQLLNFTEGNDLRDLNLNTAVLMVYLNTLEKYQSFKQIVINTDDPESVPENIGAGPSEIIVNPTKEGGGSVNVLDLQTDTKNKFEVIKQRIMTVLAGYNISPENFTMSASPQSGFALKISNIGKIEARQMQIPSYRMKEKEVFDIERIIWNFHNPNKQISQDADLMVDFAELDFPKSPDEKEKEFEFFKRNNARTDIDLILSLNPDLTREEAEEEYLRNKEFNEANREVVNLQAPQQPADQEEEEA